MTGLQPWLSDAADYLVAVAAYNGLGPTVTSTWRSYATQARLYDRYLRGMSPYPAAPPGHSMHELGRAFDLVLADMSRLPDLGALWQSWGGTWGPSDPIHFEA